MPKQHFKYNTGSTITNTIQKGIYSVATEGTQDWGPTSVTGFYPETTPPSSGYTIYYMRPSGGPSVHVANDDTQAISFLKSFGSTGSTISDVLTWASNTANYYVQTGATIGIITSGLVLNLDASNASSYPGTGTTWYDLSGNNNHATATSPQYSGSYGGSFNFPNNTTSVFFTPTYTLVPNGGVTMEAFVYPTYDTFYLNPGNGSGITGRRNAYIYGMDIGPNVTPGGIPYTSVELSGVYSGTSAALPYAITNTWYHILWTYSTTSVKSYVNGVNLSSTSGTYSTPTDTAAFRIGNRWGGYGYAFYGNISIVRWYNRPLSESEVQQNYNAQKSRFNLI